MRAIRERPMTYALILALLLFVAILQSAAISLPALFGAHVDLLLVLVAVWAVARSCEEMMLAAPLAAVLAGLLGAGSLATPVLVLLAPVGLASCVPPTRSGGNRLALAILITGLSTLWALLLSLIVAFLGSPDGMNMGGIGRILLGALLVNLVVAFLLYWPLRFIRRSQPARHTRLSLS